MRLTKAGDAYVEERLGAHLQALGRFERTVSSERPIRILVWRDAAGELWIWYGHWTDDLAPAQGLCKNEGGSTSTEEVRDG
jgi:hypothetical protein